MYLGIDWLRVGHFWTLERVCIVKSDMLVDLFGFLVRLIRCYRGVAAVFWSGPTPPTKDEGHRSTDECRAAPFSSTLSLSLSLPQHTRCIGEEAAPICFCPFLLPFSLQCAASLESEAANLLCDWSELSGLFHLKGSAIQTFSQSQLRVKRGKNRTVSPPQ